ncbi:MAG: YDG domain-containing protein [Flavobacterium sp.]|nr:YDG domain-containing protein [Flavobacterium sp.]
MELPYTGTITEGADFNAFAKVYKLGFTPPGGSSASINAWIGISTTNAITTANFNSGWTWIPANFSSQVGNDDIYTANIAGLSRPAGTYYYVSRFSVTGSTEYRYGGTNNAFWSTASNSGVLTITKPTITITPTSLTGLTYIYGSGPSTQQSFSVSGLNLTANIILSAPTNYEISLTSGSGFTPSITLNQIAGSVASTTIFVRLKSGLAVANYNETFTATSTSAIDKTVTLTGNVTPKALTVVSAVAQNKPYDATATATITGSTLVGVVGSDVVTVSGGGTFGTANVGTSISVTVALTLGGANAGNYTITQPIGLSANITAIAPTITAATINIVVGGTFTLPGANVTSNSGGLFSYTLGTVSPAGAVTLTGGNTLNGVATGTAILTINQVSNGNYLVGSTVVTVNVSACTPPFWEENFDYGGCDNAHMPNLTSNWIRFSGSSNDAQYRSSSLTYGSYPSSGIGGSFSFETSGSDDVRREFSSVGINSGSVFASFLINMNSSSSTSDDYFIALLGDANSTTAHGRAYIKREGTQFRLGVGKQSSGLSDVNTSLLNFDQTYLVVIKYEFIVGSVNDPFKMWVISSGVPASEASAGTFITATLSGTDATNLKSLAIRQTNKPKGFVDGIRVATSWESLFCGTTPTVTYTWTGASSSAWANAANWSPSGIPSSIDNIIISSPGANMLNITDCRTIKDFTLNGTGTYTASSTGIFTINGDISYTGTTTATLDCNSQVFIKSATSQLVPPLTYGNLDILGGNRVFSPTGIIKICSAFNVNPATHTYTVTNSTVEYISALTGWVMSPFTYNNLTFSGTGDFSVGYSATNANKTINVLGNFSQTNGIVYLGENASATATLNVDGNMTISGGSFNLNFLLGGTGIVNLKGDLSVSATAQLTGTVINGRVSFIGMGDGSTDALTQTIDVKNTNSVYNTAFSVNSGYTKLISQDLNLGTNSSFIVRNGAILDFGFGLDNTTALNIVRVSLPTLRIGQTFTSESGSTLKITSPFGITSGGTYTGNLQIGTSVNRTFDVGATYHYIGKANQVSGNGLPNGIIGRVIIELDTDLLTFNASGNKTFDTAGTLEIKKGIVIDDSSYSFNTNGSQLGNLSMSGGRYRISKTTIQPPFSGTYNLTGGVVEFANTSVSGQSIRSPRFYQNIEVTGNYVDNSGGVSGVVSPISLNNNGIFTISGTGKFTSFSGFNPIDGGGSGTQTLTVKTGGNFITAVISGFYGLASLEPYQSVQNSIENIILEPGSFVEYARKEGLDFAGLPFGATSGEQTITHHNFGIAPSTYSYQNLIISGTGTKSLQNATQTFVNENLSVNSSTLLVDTNEVISVKQAVSVATGATFEIKNNGQLIQVDDIANGVGEFNGNNTGNIIYNRTATGIKGYDYVYWGSPVTGQDISTIYSSPSPGFKYFWNPLANNVNSPSPIFTSGNWEPAFGVMNPGKGYIVRGSSSYGMAATDIPTVFTGVPNNGIITATVSRGGNQTTFGPLLTTNNSTVTNFDDNWNLLGNPYPSAIDPIEFLKATNNPNIEGFVYLWTHTNSPTSTVNPFYGSFAANYFSDYFTYNSMGASSGPLSQSIAAGQGFFVCMNDGEAVSGETVTFKNSMRSKTIDNSQFYRTSQVDEKHRIWLDLVDANNQSVRTLIGYATEATLGLDRMYDAQRGIDNEINIYSLVEDKTLNIQGRPMPFDQNDQVTIGVNILSAGDYKIAIAAVDGLFEQGQTIYLEDKELNLIYDLRQNPYSFSTTAGKFSDRFVLRYTNQALGNPDFVNIENSIIVAGNHGELTIKSSIENIQEVTVYDLLGRQLFFAKAISNTNFVTSNITMSQQTLIVKIKLENGMIISRKIIL